MNKSKVSRSNFPHEDIFSELLPKERYMVDQPGESRENWECLIDFTKIKKGGVNIDELKKRLQWLRSKK